MLGPATSGGDDVDASGQLFSQRNGHGYEVGLGGGGGGLDAFAIEYSQRRHCNNTRT
jgi:hypothetical protein